MNQKQTDITTGKQIRHLRTQSGMTQEELAGKLNVTRQALSNWERDVNEPDLNTLKKICFLFGVHMDDFAADATNRESLLGLKRNRAFTKAVSNMAIMDITDIEPLFMAVYELLEENGIFVFATQHPCFITLTEKYMTPHSYYDIAIEGQPEEQIYYHRSIQDIFNLCFRAGFVIDGFYEECFKNNKEIPMVMIVRLKKVKRDSLK